MQIARRRGMKKAIVALARRLAVMRSTQNIQLSTSRRPIAPSFEGLADIAEQTPEVG